jgi:hypothetical protein
MNIKNIVFKTKYTAGMYIGLFLIAIPALLFVFTSILHLVFPSDSYVTLSLWLSMVVSAVPLIVLGSILILVSAAGSGLSAFRKRRNLERNSTYKIKVAFGMLASGVILGLAYVPGGPDECSRHLTDSQYEVCVESVLANKTQAETITWLESNGYRISDTFNREKVLKDVNECLEMFDGYAGTEQELLDLLEMTPELQRQLENCRMNTEADNATISATEDYFIVASRSYGRLHSVPYGTNFARLVLPMFPAPSWFELQIEGWNTPGKAHDVEVDWSFSFL